jgi:hypothetical protein
MTLPMVLAISKTWCLLPYLRLSVKLWICNIFKISYIDAQMFVLWLILTVFNQY